jgi:hypothetical protein
MCSNSNSPEEYCFICSVCFNRFIDIEGDFKVIGADKESLEVELCEKYNELNEKKQDL